MTATSCPINCSLKHITLGSTCVCPLAQSCPCTVFNCESMHQPAATSNSVRKMELNFRSTDVTLTELKKKTYYVYGNMTSFENFGTGVQSSFQYVTIFSHATAHNCSRDWESYSLQMQIKGLGKVPRSGKNSGENKHPISRIPSEFTVLAENKKKKKDANVKR